MASEFQGRTYLLQRQNMLAMLVDEMVKEPLDTYFRQNVLGTLQKFSLRKFAQTEMIECNVIQWIVQLLSQAAQNETPLSDYSLEYATALLMNLSLRSKGKDVCESLSQQGISLIKVLSDVMEHDNLQVRTHVNGTLYSILTRVSLKDEANQLGLGELLEYMINNADQSMMENEEQMQRQMQYIYRQLTANAEPALDVQSDVEDEDDDFEETGDDEYNDDEFFGEDEDFNDTLRLEGVVTGEEWLTSQFLLSNLEAMAQSATISRRIDEENKEKLNRSDISRSNRPISPFVTGPDGNPFQQAKVALMANPNLLDRSLPSALKTRNKIPRTPDNAKSIDPNWKQEFRPD